MAAASQAVLCWLWGAAQGGARCRLAGACLLLASGIAKESPAAPL